MNTAPEPTTDTTTEPGFPLTFGLNTFGDVTRDASGQPISHAQTIRDLVGHGVAAEEAGLHYFGIGEHHTDDMPLSAADVVLGAIAARTERIHLGSAVTVLSSDDPVRVFQRYSTLNAVSDGRAEIILGRGSSIDSFPLFGFDLSDYEELFEEKTNLFAHLLEGGPVTWEGNTRRGLRDQDVVPHLAAPLPTWIGVGGSPESVIRTAHYGFSLMLAVIGGPVARFAPYTELFHQALEQFGRPQQPIGLHSPGHVAATDEQAREEFWPHFRDMMTKVSATRGFAIPTEASFQRELGPDGSLYVGSPETVATKIAANLPVVGANRFDLKYGIPGMTNESLLTNIRLFGEEVVPRVRELLA
ncbi:LLM class flavin-dependent oxidoreductase [Leifsonia sp. fls2-241-R2A-40a]|uniref:LLM class flavin-dependent oxidoreductase n=1 Tax=Leifsonia sp. fls2-241-R2A-40a TaxID=3040290 RepID=UPI00254A3B6F|nr:LLM class flavin-dependent oxidoreductase [Leifsonia sp. fls2-241-R2A-40a]